MVAPLTEKPANAPRVVIMVEVLRVRVTTDGAPITLLLTELGDRGLREAVLAVEVAVRVRRVVAPFAAAAEAGRASRVARVVPVSDRPLTCRTPPEAVRDPGVVADLPAQLPATLLVPPPTSFAVALEAVEGQAIRLRAVAPEGRRGEVSPALGTGRIHNSE